MTQTNMPHQLGNYRLVRLLGRGGFADVYLGQHAHLKSFAAVKVLRANLSAEGLADLFLQEAQTIANLTHPNIVRVMDFDVQDDVAFLVMEYAPYGSLRRQYRPGTTIPLDAVLSYTKQVAAALYYAHGQRIVHRDIKPENMLVSKNSAILLSDFGLALLAAESTRSQRTGEAAGTIGYVAPEQIEGKPRPASDQYALAVTVYEWLCGQRPFHGTPAEVTMKHLSSLPPPLRSHDPSIPPEVEAVVLQALEKDPGERFPTVQEFARALQDAAGVRPRPRADEHFAMPQQQQRVTKSNRLILPETGQSRRGNAASNMPTMRDRDLTSVRTVAQPEEASGGSRWSTRPHISRRTLLFGAAGLIGAGAAGLVFASLHSSPPPAAQLLASSPEHVLTPTTTSKASPKASPTHTPHPTATPDPAPTQAQAPAPTQAPPTPPTPSGALLTTYRGHSNVVFGIAWSPDSVRLASGSGDRTTQVWFATGGNTIATYSRAAAVNYVAWSPDGVRLASASDDKTIQVWDTTTGSLLYTCTDASSVHSVAWSPDGKRLASGSTDNTVKIWDATSGNLLQTYRDHTGSVWAVVWSPDGTRVASASSDNTVKVWNVGTGVTQLSYTGHSSRVIYIAWSPDGTRIVSGSDDTTAQVWDAATGNLSATYQGHNKTVYGVAWSPDSRYVASGSVDTTVQVWDAASGATQLVYRGHSSFVFGVAWSPEGKRIASASDDRTVQVWRVWQ